MGICDLLMFHWRKIDEPRISRLLDQYFICRVFWFTGNYCAPDVFLMLLFCHGDTSYTSKLLFSFYRVLLLQNKNKIKRRRIVSSCFKGNNVTYVVTLTFEIRSSEMADHATANLEKYKIPRVAVQTTSNILVLHLYDYM